MEFGQAHSAQKIQSADARVGDPAVLLNTESIYDWTADEWTVPLNLLVSHVYQAHSYFFGNWKVATARTPQSGPSSGVSA